MFPRSDRLRDKPGRYCPTIKPSLFTLQVCFGNNNVITRDWGRSNVKEPLVMLKCRQWLLVLRPIVLRLLPSAWGLPTRLWSKHRCCSSHLSLPAARLFWLPDNNFLGGTSSQSSLSSPPSCMVCGKLPRSIDIYVIRKIFYSAMYFSGSASKAFLQPGAQK